jgi:hypothetical protein
LTIFVAAKVFAPDREIFGMGESAIGSSKVAVMIREVPDFTGLLVEYVMAAVGDVLSIVIVIEPDAVDSPEPSNDFATIVCTPLLRVDVVIE